MPGLVRTGGGYEVYQGDTAGLKYC